MKTLDKKARREIFILLGLFLIFAILLTGWTWLKSDSSPFKNLHGSDSPWRIGNNRWRQPVIALSPNGLYLAGICPTPPDKNTSGFPNTTLQGGGGFQSNDLVIWRVSDRSELARKKLGIDSGSEIQWSSNGQMLSASSDASHLFLWNSQALTAFGNKVIARPTGDRNDYVMKTRFDLDSDIYLIARQNGIVQAYRPSTGAELPIAWRWTKDTRDDSGFGVDFIPQPGISGGSVRAIISESNSRLQHLIAKSKPVAPAPPIPKPKPQPIFSAEQKAFLEKEKALNTEVEDVVNKLMSDEGELSDTEKAQLEARANELNAQIKAERNRLFPPAPQPKALPPMPRWAQISFWDLSGNRLIWRKRVREGFDTPTVSWSPDGKLLAILGVAQPTKDSNASNGESNWQRSGIEFCDGLTGKTISKATRNDDSGFDEKNGFFWIDGPRLVVKDRSAEQTSQKILRFIDPSSGTTTQLLQFPEIMKTADVISTDTAGTTWVFASGQDGWHAYSTAELQGAVGSETQ